jgi:hypothetical protein
LSGTVAGVGTVYNGSTWVKAPVKLYDGTQWVVKPMWVYNGTSWVLTTG